MLSCSSPTSWPPFFASLITPRVLSSMTWSTEVMSATSSATDFSWSRSTSLLVSSCQGLSSGCPSICGAGYSQSYPCRSLVTLFDPMIPPSSSVSTEPTRFGWTSTTSLMQLSPSWGSCSWTITCFRSCAVWSASLSLESESETSVSSFGGPLNMAPGLCNEGRCGAGLRREVYD